MNKSYKIEITTKTIIKAFVLAGVAWLFIQLTEIIFVIFIAFSVSAMLSPVIDYLHVKKMPRGLSISLIYFLSFSTLVVLLLLSYKPIVTQMEIFIQEFPTIITNFADWLIEKIPFVRDKFNWDQIFENLKQSFLQNFQISSLSDYFFTGVKQAFGIVGSIFGGLINVISVFVLSIYFIQFKEPSKQKILSLLPGKHQKRVLNFINALEKNLGAWLRAQVLLMTMVGVLAWFGLELIGADFSIPLGISAALLEAVPGIGPTISLIFALTVSIGSHFPLWKILFVTVWFVLIQLFENYLIVPKLMQKVVGINPMLTLIAILGASKIMGLWGALLAVPIVAIFQISLTHYLKYRKDNNRD
ncbi:MAG: AI-2E family transporter [Patescibacteria group bacterium]|nr:AI-2E family transporter [Patescibacteria group bacterium]